MTPLELIEKHPAALTDIADLEDKGHRIVDVLGGDVSPTEVTRDFVAVLREERRDSFFSEILHYLTSERYPEAQAQVLWKEILDHKFLMSERLGRNVGIRVSAFDYLLNVRKLLIAPRIINSHDFKRTVRLSRTDALTGLYNRRYFLEHAAKVLEAAAHVKAPVTLLMADLDNFKPFNDEHGHQAGDLLLQEIARLIRGCVRASDMVARYGGDEMALLLPKATKAEAEIVARKICQQIEENCQTVGVTISLGLAQFPTDASSREDLIGAADELLYRAKEFGGNQVSLFRPVRFHYAEGKDPVNQIAVVGDFNNWANRAHGLQRHPAVKEWEVVLPLKPGRYRYKFLVNDDHWIADPAADIFESDGFGGQCSVVVVK
ncbi:MAG: diguanylate cyclase [Elusimicrobia bacterium]|nr:diguanylate cyclase [Elusimicrobiota bacterium]